MSPVAENDWQIRKWIGDPSDGTPDRAVGLEGTEQTDRLGKAPAYRP